MGDLRIGDIKLNMLWLNLKLGEKRFEKWELSFFIQPIIRYIKKNEIRNKYHELKQVLGPPI